MPDKTPKNPSYPDCVAYCPRCGADLTFIDNECICKKECGWHCQGCKEDDDV
jgi:hypothetical protein